MSQIAALHSMFASMCTATRFLIPHSTAAGTCSARWTPSAQIESKKQAFKAVNVQGSSGAKRQMLSAQADINGRTAHAANKQKHAGKRCTTHCQTIVETRLEAVTETTDGSPLEVRKAPRLAPPARREAPLRRAPRCGRCAPTHITNTHKLKHVARKGSTNAAA